MTLRDNIMAAARAYPPLAYGLPPRPGETDCSLFVRDVFAAAGVPFPAGIRTAEQEREASVPIGWNEVLPGDLLIFTGTYDAGVRPDGQPNASHIGISLGKGTGKMWDAHERANGGPAAGVTIINPSDYWQPKLAEARRHPVLAGAGITDIGEAMPTVDRPRGIDVSSNNGSVDWGAVAASGISFAFIKVTEDDGYLNPNFEHDWPLSKRAGLIRGAYHFARPEGADAITEADWCLDQIAAHGGLETGDLLALDLESGSGDQGQWALDFLHRVEAREGFKALVYTGAGFASQYNLAAYPELSQHGLWLASYRATMPAAPAPWEGVAIWQHSDSGSVPGVSGNVDMNVFNGSLERLPLYGKGAAPAQPPAPTVDDWQSDLNAIWARHETELDALLERQQAEVRNFVGSLARR